MDPTFVAWLGVFAYLVAIIVFFSAWKKSTGQGSVSRTRGAILALGALAVLLHGLTVFNPLTWPPQLDFGFLSTLSLVIFLINLMLLVGTLFKPIDKLVIVTFPLGSLVLALKTLLHEGGHPIDSPSVELELHIFSSLVAFSFLSISAIQAMLIALQDACLRKRDPGGVVIRSLPSLQSMETLLFQLIGAGLLFLTVSLASGFLFLEDMFAQHLAHKTLLSILAWCLFASLLLGRLRFGWRGPMAIRWTLGGFLALLLAYFGSKLVLELILRKTWSLNSD